MKTETNGRYAFLNLISDLKNSPKLNISLFHCVTPQKISRNSMGIKRDWKRKWNANDESQLHWQLKILCKCHKLLQLSFLLAMNIWYVLDNKATKIWHLISTSITRYIRIAYFWRGSGTFIVDFKHIQHNAQVFPFLTLNVYSPITFDYRGILKTLLNILANVYLSKVKNRNTRTRCEICFKLTIKRTRTKPLLVTLNISHTFS